MEFYTDTQDYDLITPDAKIEKISEYSEGRRVAELLVENIPKKFVGFSLPKEALLFNIKSTLAQIGINGVAVEMELDPKFRVAKMRVELVAFGSLAKKTLSLLEVGACIGKLFAQDERRRVRDPFYLNRMFGRSDRFARPLLSLGGMHGSQDLLLDKVEGRCVAYLRLRPGVVNYSEGMEGFLPTIAKGLKCGLPLREQLILHQELDPTKKRFVQEGEILLVKTQPLHIRTVFAKVVDELLVPGFYHTTASILQPDTTASGDIYEFYGNSEREIADIPLEFYTLEPYREFVFFSDRDQLQSVIDDPKIFFEAFKTAPEPLSHRAATFVVKGEQLLHLEQKDWIAKETHPYQFPQARHTARQALLVERYIQQQPSYAYLKDMEDNIITSQGILLSRYFPSPLMKRMFLSDNVQRLLKGIYFFQPSKSQVHFFSHEDRAFLHDLEVFGIPVFWVDEGTCEILQYVEKPKHENGLFVPLGKVTTFLEATLFGIYGSNLVQGSFEQELCQLLSGLLDLKEFLDHPLLNPETPLALVTGGGPGAMEVGNRVAKQVGVLSCANLLDFRAKPDQVVNEQKQNPYIEAKMTYRIDRLIERQAEFNLDFPIFLMGGIGTDFEFSLEMVRRKVGSCALTPILLFGTREYWRQKITGPFRCNVENGTIRGSEWVSNCLYVIETAEEALEVYKRFFTGELPLGPEGPVFEEGFCAALPKAPFSPEES